MTKIKGFNLLEAMLVLGIVAILLWIGMPIASVYYEQTKADTYINKLHSGLELARNEAIKRNAVVTLCPSTDNMHCSQDWNAYLLIFADPAQKHQPENSQAILRIIQAPPLGQLRWQGFGSQNYLEFTPQGLNNQQNGTFIYCTGNTQNKQARGIIISKTGRARIASSNPQGDIILANGTAQGC